MATRILGLDLGTNSIGWAVVDKEVGKIIDCGVRIFPEGVEAKTIGTGDKEQSRNATRRDKRQMRRQYYRKRLRRIKLLEALIEINMCPLPIDELKKWKNWDKKNKTEGKKFPNTDAFNTWLKLNPYELRSKALKETLTREELGRVFYHFIHRRGFLSSRKGDEDPKTLFEKGKPEENILPVNETREKAKDSSLGSYLNKISYKEGEPYKTTTDENGKEIRVRGRYTTREMYVEEFEKIWNTQAETLGLNNEKLTVKKVRELKGTLKANRVKKRIETLTQKYGKDQLTIEESDKGIKITTTKQLPLKQFLAGNIERNEDEEGNTRFKFKSNESVLFWQRPLRSQKSLISNCRFENNIPVLDKDGNYVKNTKGKIQTRSKKPCPLSHPEFELYRTYQFVNNIRFGRGDVLNETQRKIVIELINSNDGNFNFEKIPQKLELAFEKFNYADDLKVAGNTTIKVLMTLFPAEVWEKQYDEIWHCCYFYEDNDKLFEKLKRDFQFKGDIEKLKKIKLKEGYGNVSLRAIRNINPYLVKGFQFDKAVILGGVRNAFGSRWENFKGNHFEIEKNVLAILCQDNKDGEAIDKIKEMLATPAHFYGFSKDDHAFGRLYHHSQDIETKEELDEWMPEVENVRNPIVQQGLHETRRLVNALLRKYRAQIGADFNFDQIKVEMGRDLRNSKKQRQELSFKMRDNEARNEEARQRLAEYGLQPSRNNIQKYLMYDEIVERNGKAQCPYTAKIISMKQLLGTDNAIQIEHIIPFSVSLDDGFGNKTLCEAQFNGLKGEKTPHEFYEKNPDPLLWGARSWDEIAERAFKILPYAKARRFTSKKKFEKSSFIERQLNDSRYIARKAVELLSHICSDVRVMPGQLTAELRHLWGLNNVLQPVQNLGKQAFDVDEEVALPYFVITNEEGEVEGLQRKLNPKPETVQNEILLPGKVVKNEFKSGKYSFEINAENKKDGNYWARLKVNGPIRIQPKYTPKPNVSEDYVVLKGKVVKGQFNNDTTGNFKTEQDDGIYWAIFTINRKKLELAHKEEKPKTTKNQLLLFGAVSQSVFKSYVYSCQTNLVDGKYWAILDIDKTSVEFTLANNPTPSITPGELVITATIDEHGTLSAKEDKDFSVSTKMEAGAYYAVLEIVESTPELFIIENEPLKPEKGQKLVEGNIWLDKATGEIKFDPKKQRDDHRHHAVDAITIAFTEQGSLQRLSTYNAQRKEKQRGHLDSTDGYPEPWQGFAADVTKAVNGILVSYKKNNKTLTKSRKGYSVRGQLHKENVFGKRQAPNHETAFHRRTKITELKNNKHIAKVVDDAIRKLILDHLRDNCQVDITNPKGFDVPKDAFIKDGDWQLFLPNKNGDKVPIKKVRIKEKIGNAANLKSGINQWVNPRNNHHVLIYKDLNGDLKEDVVQFWTVVERRLQNQPVYQLPEDGTEISTILETNDLFLLGLKEEEREITWDNTYLLNKHLYRVQKISAMFYTFRHHLASTLDNKDQEWYFRSIGAWEAANPIKVKMNELGELTRY